MTLPAAWSARMHRVALGLVAGGLLATAASEAWWSAARLPAALAGWPRPSPDLPRSVVLVLDVAHLLAPTGVILLACMAVSRNLPGAHRRAALAGLAGILSCLLVLVAPWPRATSMEWTFWTPAMVGVGAAAVGLAALGWTTGRRGLLAAGAALLALRYPLLALAQSRYVHASGDPAAMQAALAWGLVPGAVAAVGLLLLAAGLLAPPRSGKAYSASTAMEPT